MSKQQKKSKPYLHESFASNDAEENDLYLKGLKELADQHPELRNEYETFRIYQAGFTNGCLNQVRSFYNMMLNVKTHKEEDGEFFRPEFEGVDCIAFDKQTKFKNMTREQFITWINTMAKNGDIPKGEWFEYQNEGLKYVFNDSIMPEDLAEREKNNNQSQND